MTDQKTQTTIEAAEHLCKIYFDIAAKIIGEDEVRRLRDEKIKNPSMTTDLQMKINWHRIIAHLSGWLTRCVLEGILIAGIIKGVLPHV